ncbi:MAG: CsgG/HfaB family protein [candidate division KSB1 bacterium]|nr:CsgG/HfaB family protein [candidate division KSB1 bacterium]MDZ7335910.1 CsgG/HfaB family protein [candidate division KSB1 bacterium]MDZ7356025.1 CsgG/HfaB family protein [candidate division KSB1 bacterium]MDZ7400641.1 CsgG/HfaB family protein [candidate division KSB1 bacterium]
MLISKAKIAVAFILFLLLLVACALMPELDSSRTDRIVKGPEFVPYYGLKRRLAILDFENLSDLGGAKFGSAIADQLISLVARSNRYTLVERSQIEQILREQALGQSGAVAEQTAPEVGKLLGVEALVLGKILSASETTELRKIEDEEKKWSFKLKTTIGEVRLAYKIVDTSTGEILFANDITEREIKPSFGLKTKTIDLENWGDFENTVLGLAVRKAVNRMAQDIVDCVSRIDWVGTVVQCKGDSVVYFTPGRNAGIELAQLFEIFNKPLGLLDSLAQSDSDSTNQSKAKIKVVGFVGDRVARAQVVEGKNIQRGDIVRPLHRVWNDLQ